MAYDLHGSFDYPGNTYFQAPYGAEALDPYAAKNWNIQAAMNEYEKFSVPSNTLVLGVPLYGRAVTVTTFGATGGLEQAIASATPPYGDYDDASSGPTGIFLYKCIVNASSCNANGSTISALNFINYLNPLFTTYSSSAQEPWAYGAGPQGNIFLTYDDVHAAVYKTQQVKKNNFGGVMVWELDGDTQDPATSLIANMKAELNK